MAKEISTFAIRKYLGRQGPYIYFYDEKCEGLNHEMIEYINEKASKFPMIKVFKVDWTNKIRIHPHTPIDSKEKIFLYYGGRQVENLFFSDRPIIDYIFSKAAEFYNLNILNRVQNLGSNRRIIWEDDTKLDVQKIIKNEKLKEEKLKYRQDRLLKQKITINCINKYSTLNSKNQINLVDNSKPKNTFNDSLQLYNEPKYYFPKPETTQLAKSVKDNTKNLHKKYEDKNVRAIINSQNFRYISDSQLSQNTMICTNISKQTQNIDQTNFKSKQKNKNLSL